MSAVSAAAANDARLLMGEGRWGIVAMESVVKCMADRHQSEETFNTLPHTFTIKQTAEAVSLRCNPSYQKTVGYR